MNFSSISVNNTFTAIARAADRARPVSHAATVTLLGTSVYAIHAAAESNLPGALVTAATAALVACEWLQWTALGRLAKLEDAADDTRANSLRLQCLGIGALQCLGYTAAVIHFAATSGQDWSQGWALAASVAIAVGFALLNFSAKFNSCEAPAVPKPARTQSADAIVFGGSPIQPAIGRPALGAPPAGPDGGSALPAFGHAAGDNAEKVALLADWRAMRDADDAGRRRQARDPATGKWAKPAPAKARRKKAA